MSKLISELPDKCIDPMVGYEGYCTFPDGTCKHCCLPPAPNAPVQEEKADNRE